MTTQKNEAGAADGQAHNGRAVARLAGVLKEDWSADWRLLGLGFWQVWQMVAMCTPLLVPQGDDTVSLGNPVLVLLLLIAASYLLVVLLSRRFAPFMGKRIAFVLAGGGTAVGSILMPLGVQLVGGAAGYGLFVAGAVAAAFGNALLLIMWGELWSALATGRVGRHLYASYTFAFVLFFIIYALPPVLAVAVTALMSVVSAAILSACRREPRREPSVIPLDMKTIPVARLLLCIFVISLIWGLSQGLVVTFAAGDEYFMAKSLLLAGAGIGAITLSMMVSQAPSEAMTLYRPVIPAMVVGLIFLLLQPPLYPFLGSGLIIMGIYCLDMLMMLVSTDVAFRGRVSVAMSFGLVILIARAGTLGGSMGADWLLGASVFSQTLCTDVLLLAVLALAIVGMLFFTIADVQRLYVTPRLQKTDASLEEKCAAIAKMCRLTNRESEVLVLLARGRSVPYISDELHIAQGTAKHHVSNIYRKVGVVDRQGLLDTIEQGGVGKPGWDAADR
ncbi:MAG: helix-turn-helix transcriptional regulator [Adlercreutzia sp.]|nr:helix-turn-helix transcriptional regulator [Adlercreutzia sp.]